jgi:hypothetical protein
VTLTLNLYLGGLFVLKAELDKKLKLEPDNDVDDDDDHDDRGMYTTLSFRSEGMKGTLFL